MARVLLINPSYMGSYNGNKMSVISPIYPVLSLATLGGSVRSAGHEVELLDLSYIQYDPKFVWSTIERVKPDVVGITALTPAVNQLIDMSFLIKELAESIIVIGGGPHASSLPLETMKQSSLDGIVVGEGDFSFVEICDGRQFEEISGLHFRDGSEIKFTGHRTPISDLNLLPMPAWDLYDPKTYVDKISRILAKRRPVATVEFSRGCVFRCDYCASKMTMHLGYRKKSPQRCADEVRRLYEIGYREFMVADDIFTSDEKWATEVSQNIAALNIDMPWTCTNGIRVESADERLFKTMNEAGCYRVSFGFESGNDAVLKKFGKGGKATIDKAKNAVRIARKSGIETNGFFMIGLSCDTEETMNETIGFAKTLPLDMLKFSATVAFPGTEMFNNYVKKGLIRTYEWDDYHIYSSVQLFAHENLDFSIVQRYMKKAYREAIIFNPRFIMRRIIRGLRTNEFLWDVYYFFRFISVNTTNHTKINYYARDRWNAVDFIGEPPSKSIYQKVRGRRETTIESV